MGQWASCPEVGVLWVCNCEAVQRHPEVTTAQDPRELPLPPLWSKQVTVGNGRGPHQGGAWESHRCT